MGYIIYRTTGNSAKGFAVLDGRSFTVKITGLTGSDSAEHTKIEEKKLLNRLLQGNFGYQPIQTFHTQPLLGPNLIQGLSQRSLFSASRSAKSTFSRNCSTTVFSAVK
jgi:hypothetical protein